MENLVGNVVDYVAERLVFPAVVDRGDHIVIIPAPVFFPGKGITNHRTMPLQCEIRVHVMIVLRIKADTLHHAVYGAHFRKLGVFDGECKLIGYDFPAHFTVERN